MIERNLTCPHCGTRADEWDPKKGGNRVAYVPEIRRCEGCARAGMKMEDASKEAKSSKGNTHGLRVTMTPISVYREKMKARREDPKYVEAEKRKHGVELMRERKARRKAALEVARIEREIEEAEMGMHPIEDVD